MIDSRITAVQLAVAAGYEVINHRLTEKLRLRQEAWCKPSFRLQQRDDCRGLNRGIQGQNHRGRIRNRQRASPS